jgi:hypothetical protein
MGYSAVVKREPGSTFWAVKVTVDLTREESNDLFLSGDTIVSWPGEGLRASEADNPPLERMGMFVSEMAARPLGVGLRYEHEDQAKRAAALFRAQFRQIGIKEDA